MMDFNKLLTLTFNTRGTAIHGSPTATLALDFQNNGMFGYVWTVRMRAGSAPWQVILQSDQTIDTSAEKDMFCAAINGMTQKQFVSFFCGWLNPQLQQIFAGLIGPEPAPVLPPIAPSVNQSNVVDQLNATVTRDFDLKLVGNVPVLVAK